MSSEDVEKLVVDHNELSTEMLQDVHLEVQQMVVEKVTSDSMPRSILPEVRF